MTDCVICGHSMRVHAQDGCEQRGLLRSACACSHAEQPPLPPGADAAMHRARSDRWDRQAQTSWALASDAKDDLDRWYALMRFHRFARRAEIDHRLHAGSLLGPVPANTAPPEFEHPPEYLTVPVEAAQPTLSLSQRLELAEIT